MATKTTLPTNFQDDILATTANGRRKYNIINNADGTISLEDVTEYTQTGSDYGAKQINATNTAVNACYSSSEVDTKLNTKVNTANILNSASSLLSATDTSKIAGAVGIKGLKDYIPTNQVSSYTGNLNSLGTGIFSCDLSKCSNCPSGVTASVVDILSYKNALQIIIPPYSNGSYTAFRKYTNGWGAWVVEHASDNFNDAYKNGIIANALNVNLNTPYSTQNATYLVDRYGSTTKTTNLPSNCRYGVREVSWLGQNRVFVRITGYDDRLIPRVWINNYATNDQGKNVWFGWSMLTQGLDRTCVSRMFAESKVITGLSGGTSVLLSTNADVNKIFGVTNASNQNTMILAINGDGNADTNHYEGCTYKGGNWYVTFSNTNTAPNIRVNYIIFYWGDGDKYNHGYGSKIG